MSELKWKSMETKVWGFHLDPEPEVIYVIEGCSAGNYIVVHEDAFGYSTGQTEIMTKEAVEEKYGIKLQ